MTLVLTIAEADEKMRNAGADAAVSVEFNNEGSHPIGGWGAFVKVYSAMIAARPALCSEIDKARAEVIEAAEKIGRWQPHKVLNVDSAGRALSFANDLGELKDALTRLRSLEGELAE